MKLAIISDTHFGDTACALVTRQDGVWTLDEERFSRLRTETLGADQRRADFLILLGDVFDFSIASYQDAYEAGRRFFLRAGELARDVIYLPGNHDCDFWHLVDFEVSVMKKIAGRHPPQPLMRTAPALLDDREEKPAPVLIWPVSGLDYARERKRARRAGLFIDSFFQETKGDRDRERPCFWMAYPNLYLRTRSGETALLTHGHYFRDYWAVGSELAVELAAPELVHDPPDPHFGRCLRLADAVGVNFPLSQLACSGIGQAHPLTPLARAIQRGIKRRDAALVDSYVARLPQALAAALELGWEMTAALKLFVAAVRPYLRRKISVYQDAQGNPDFLKEQSVRENLGRYLLATFREIEDINRLLKLDGDRRIKPPATMIYGHTHARTPWNGGRGDPAPDPVEGHCLRTFNCGGWLLPEGQTRTPAELFIYQSDDSQEFHSISID